MHSKSTERGVWVGGRRVSSRSSVFWKGLRKAGTQGGNIVVDNFCCLVHKNPSNERTILISRKRKNAHVSQELSQTRESRCSIQRGTHTIRKTWLVPESSSSYRIRLNCKYIPFSSTAAARTWCAIRFKRSCVYSTNIVDATTKKIISVPKWFATHAPRYGPTCGLSPLSPPIQSTHPTHKREGGVTS